MLVVAQLNELRAHMKTLEPVLENETYAALQTMDSPTWYRFAHYWLCVNCLSYTPPGTKRPKNPNEAMALCPGMDLLNHGATASVRAKYDRSGYFVSC